MTPIATCGCPFTHMNRSLVALRSLTQFTVSDHEPIRYYGFVTEILEHETLTQVDPGTLEKLTTAADNYEHGPARLKAAILEAARRGEKPADIARAIGYVYTYDYVARLIREDRKRDAA